ncbi:uncharacterized protein FIBRA_08758 [Fibroporia radiculosa]|uniref:Uncharacterized protein n=1 Tax=Fibroporia radiculosa TaxID=599839 RepID=J4H5C3_9APHY|nr:uncharacterized protein FIBRA_08758 [Fibroporia radiculosa]CCM06489.1 predicted protein [Fibroporia radiculosa]
MDTYILSSERQSFSNSHPHVSPMPDEFASQSQYSQGPPFSFAYDYQSQPAIPDPSSYPSQYIHGMYAYPSYPQPEHSDAYAYPAHTHLSYHDPSEYIFSLPEQSNQYIQEVPLHAPVPLSGISPFMSSEISLAPVTMAHANTSVPETANSTDKPQFILPGLAHEAAAENAAPLADQNPLVVFGSLPRTMFPTPSELLAELNARDSSHSGATATGADAASSEVAAAAGCSGAGAARNAGKADDESAAPVLPKQPETQRKAYFRAVAESIGFAPTDPDTITSHDKKRSYLECLEHYVQWLHEQIRLAGHEPIPLERVSTYRGLNSRSIRTILVRMQDVIRDLNVQTLEEEREFANLQMQASVQQATGDVQQLRRHSIPACRMSGAGLTQPFLQGHTGN